MADADDSEFHEIVLTPADEVTDGTEQAPQGDGDKLLDEPVEGEKPETDKPADHAKDDKEPEKDPLRDENGRFKKNSEGRIAELTFARREAERQRDAALAQLKAAQGGETPTSKPKAADFEDYGEYVEALTDWKVAERERTSADSRVKAATEAATQHHQAEWGAKLGEAKIAMPDFDTVMEKADTPTAPHVAQAIMEADRGPEILYHLAKHPEVVDRLNEMSPGRAAIELGKIEATLAAPAPAPKPRETTTSRAPAPITPVPAGSTVTKDPSKMSMDEYKAYRESAGIR